MPELDLPQLLNLSDYADEIVEPQVPLARVANTNAPAPQLSPELMAALTPPAPTLMDTIGNIATGLGRAAVPFTSPQYRQGLENLYAQAAQAQERRRLERAAQETQALTQLFSTALASGDPVAVTNTIKQLSGLKGLQPETIQNLQKFQLQLSEQAGRFARNQKALEAIPVEINNPKVAVLRVLLSSGVDEDTAKIIASAIPEPKPVEPFTLSAGQTRYVPTPEGKFAVVQGPEKVTDEIPHATQVELERAGVRLAGRSRVSQIQPQEWEKLNQVSTAQRLAEKRDALEMAASIRAQERADTPINEKALFYVDPATLMNPSPDTSRSDLGASVKSGKLVSVRPQDVQNLREMKARVEQLLDMRRIAQRLLATSPGENITRAVQLAVKRGLASSVDAALFNGWGNALSLQVAADFNKGRPSDADRQAVQNVLFNERDTVKTALGKVDELIKHYDRLASKNLGVPIDPRKTGSTPTLPGARSRVHTLSEDFK